MIVEFGRRCLHLLANGLAHMGSVVERARHSLGRDAGDARDIDDSSSLGNRPLSPLRQSTDPGPMPCNFTGLSGWLDICRCPTVNVD
jgi:hypothetical protein